MRSSVHFSINIVSNLCTSERPPKCVNLRNVHTSRPKCMKALKLVTILSNRTQIPQNVSRSSECAIRNRVHIFLNLSRLWEMVCVSGVFETYSRKSNIYFTGRGSSGVSFQGRPSYIRGLLNVSILFGMIHLLNQFLLLASKISHVFEIVVFVTGRTRVVRPLFAYPKVLYLWFEICKTQISGKFKFRFLGRIFVHLQDTRIRTKTLLKWHYSD